MADRRAVRASSRRNTPTPQPPSKANTPTAARTSTRNATRATRSQSHEVETPAVAPAPATKNTRRGARQASTESVGSTDSRASRTIRGLKKQQKKVRAPPDRDLTTVEEDEDAEHVVDVIPEQEAPGTPPLQDQISQPLPHRSPGGFSNISGTTAYSSASTAEAQDLEAGMMLADLEDLYNNAESFLNVMAPKDARTRDFEKVLKDMRIPGSTTSKSFLKRSKGFNDFVEAFKGEDRHYILPRAVSKTLFGSQQDLNTIPGRPDAVLYKANLAVLARRLLTDRGIEAIWKDVQQLDLSFPELFLSRFSDELNERGDTSTLLEQTFKVALEIRTQVAILDLAQEVDMSESFDPDRVLQTVFLKGSLSDQEDQDYPPFVRGWNVGALGAGLAEIPQPFKDAVVRRMEEIRAFFDPNSPAVDIDPLRAKYSWDSFCVRVLQWVRDRNQEIEASIAHIGIKGLKNQVERSVKSVNPGAAPAEITETPRGPRISNISAQSKKSRRSSRVHFTNPDAYDFLLRGPQAEKQAKSRETALNQKTAPTALGVDQEIIEDDWQAAPIDDEEPEDPQEESSTSRFPPSTNDRVARLAHEEQIQKENQKQRFIDPQANPERVTFDDDIEATQPTPRPSRKSKGKAPIRASTTSPGRPSTVAPRAQKRTYAQTVQEDSDDDDDVFQQDTRQPDVSKRRKAGPTASRLRFEEPIEVPPSHQPQRRFPENRSRSRSVPVRPASEDSDFENENEDAAPVSSNYRQVQQQVKRMAPAFPARQQQRRARNPWTARAEDQLVQYIEEYGCQWAYIRRLDEADTQMFLDRTDVDLKDKARNMKINYLRSGTGLPENFDGITISQSLARRYGLVEDA
ncbi:hypothetical protein BU16DRAFT_613777 [Lophium mytilinum]|uniref:Myb-like domain-containing protein n=1 Tax=Lophium mytilinum TaxID=390894 RepID=A0A6A6R7X7_9PEZI|nr:hypothetical protein BU16DRAFT_613777 [Lophium mytilinum]